jgi:hypothetical protein
MTLFHDPFDGGDRGHAEEHRMRDQSLKDRNRAPAAAPVDIESGSRYEFTHDRTDYGRRPRPHPDVRWIDSGNAHSKHSTSKEHCTDERRERMRASE